MPFFGTTDNSPMSAYRAQALVDPDAILFAGAVPFGSRALGVSTKSSDYDFAILKSNYEAMYDTALENRYPLKNYFKVVPKSGNNYMAIHSTKDGTKVDILVLEHQSDVDIVRDAIKLVKRRYISSFLCAKTARIEAYEKALLMLGFRTRWPVAICRWLSKHF